MAFSVEIPVEKGCNSAQTIAVVISSSFSAAGFDFICTCCPTGIGQDVKAEVTPVFVYTNGDSPETRGHL